MHGCLFFSDGLSVNVFGGNYGAFKSGEKIIDRLWETPIFPNSFPPILQVPLYRVKPIHCLSERGGGKRERETKEAISLFFLFFFLRESEGCVRLILLLLLLSLSPLLCIS